MDFLFLARGVESNSIRFRSRKLFKKENRPPAGTRLWRDLALTASRTDGADVAVENLRQAALSRPLAVTHTHAD